jgi:hypothetical protein
VIPKLLLLFFLLGPQGTSDSTFSGPLFFQNDSMSVVMICQAAGTDPEDYYDCKLEPGHTLTEVVRLAMRQVRNLQLEREANRKEEIRLLTRWQKMLEGIEKQLPKPVPQSKRNTS